MMYPHLGFYVFTSCSDDICAIGYDESTVMHKKRTCVYKRDECFQSKIEKFLCRESLKIPDSVIRLIEREIYTTLITYCTIVLSGRLTNYTNTRTTVEKE